MALPDSHWPDLTQRLYLTLNIIWEFQNVQKYFRIHSRQIVMNYRMVVESRRLKKILKEGTHP